MKQNNNTNTCQTNNIRQNTEEIVVEPIFEHENDERQTEVHKKFT